MEKINLSKLLNYENLNIPGLSQDTLNKIFSNTSRKKYSILKKLKYFVPVGMTLIIGFFVFHQFIDIKTTSKQSPSIIIETGVKVLTPTGGGNDSENDNSSPISDKNNINTQIPKIETNPKKTPKAKLEETLDNTTNEIKIIETTPEESTEQINTSFEIQTTPSDGNIENTPAPSSNGENNELFKYIGDEESTTNVDTIMMKASSTPTATEFADTTSDGSTLNEETGTISFNIENLHLENLKLSIQDQNNYTLNGKILNIGLDMNEKLNIYIKCMNTEISTTIFSQNEISLGKIQLNSNESFNINLNNNSLGSLIFYPEETAIPNATCNLKSDNENSNINYKLEIIIK